jgi:chromosome segregation ATPase
MLTAVEVYKKIAPKLGDEEATELIAFIEESVQRGAATKADLQETARELETNFRKEIADVRKEIADVRKEIADVRKEIADVRKEIAELRSLLIKYIIPIASLIGAVVGTVLGIVTR